MVNSFSINIFIIGRWHRMYFNLWREIRWWKFYNEARRPRISVNG